jgi:plasmid maintenance system antidote protein VapI
MDYEELVRNIGKSGLSIKEFAELIKANPNSITNLKNKGKIPKNLAIISVLLGELVDKKIPYKHLFEELDLQEQKARRVGKKEDLFKKKDKK